MLGVNIKRDQNGYKQWCISYVVKEASKNQRQTKVRLGPLACCSLARPRQTHIRFQFRGEPLQKTIKIRRSPNIHARGSPTESSEHGVNTVFEHSPWAPEHAHVRDYADESVSKNQATDGIRGIEDYFWSPHGEQAIWTQKVLRD